MSEAANNTTETVVPFPSLRKRVCGTCTECCKGPLPATVLGHELRRGSPCPKLGCNGCTIYAERPKDPCQDYECAWLKHNEIPDWMQPVFSGVIISERVYKNRLLYLEAVECVDREMTTEVFNWFMDLLTRNPRTNLKLQMKGTWHKFSNDEEFVKDQLV